MTESVSGSANIRLPVTGAGFRWEGTALLADTARARAAFTTRIGGVCPAPWDSLNVGWSVAGDEAPEGWDDMVAANRCTAGASIGADGSWSTVHQVHGAVVHGAAEPRGPRRGPDGDAVWTSDPTKTIAVFAADCLPVLLVADRKVAVAHAGWRGLVAGVVQNTAHAIGADEAWIGPGIGPCCYEVSPGVAAQFEQPGPKIDLWSATAEAAREAGVQTIHTAGLCTSCHPDLFFSHRRDRGRTGRQALVARLP